MKSRDEHLTLIRQHSQVIEPLPTSETAVLRKLNNIEAVLFDVYGTLFISPNLETETRSRIAGGEAFCQVMNEAGLSFSADGVVGVECFRDVIRASHEKMQHQGIDFPEVDILEIWRETLGRLQAKGQLRGLSQDTDIATISLRFELISNPTWPMPGAGACLTALSSRGIRLGLISNAQWFSPLLFPALLGGEIESFGISQDMQFWSYVYGRSKPSEYLYQLAAETLLAQQIKPDCVLFVGNDMLKDMIPATSVGFRTALFAGDKRSLCRHLDDPRTAEFSVDIVATQLRDILSCVRPESLT